MEAQLDGKSHSFFSKHSFNVVTLSLILGHV